MFNANKGQQMELPQDLKDYRAPLGAFQIIEPDTAVFLIVAVGFALWLIFGGR